MNLQRKPFNIMKVDEEKDNKSSSLNDKEILKEKENMLAKQENEEKELVVSSDDKSDKIEKYIENDSNNNIKFKELNEENNVTPKNQKEKNYQKEPNSNNILLNISTPSSTE